MLCLSDRNWIFNFLRLNSTRRLTFGCEFSLIFDDFILIQRSTVDFIHELSKIQRVRPASGLKHLRQPFRILTLDALPVAHFLSFQPSKMSVIVLRLHLLGINSEGFRI